MAHNTLKFNHRYENIKCYLFRTRKYQCTDADHTTDHYTIVYKYAFCSKIEEVNHPLSLKRNTVALSITGSVYDVREDGSIALHNTSDTICHDDFLSAREITTDEFIEVQKKFDLMNKERRELMTKIGELLYNNIAYRVDKEDFNF